MLTKFVPVARTLNAVARQQAVRCMGGHAPAHWKTDSEVATEEKSHMNDMPVPQGSWQENYNRRNSKWNIQLGVSFAALLVTLFVMTKNNIFYLHDMPKLKKN
ncbi:uncharacterized protein LOC143298788 [Babylonia areolata]|uniref:uncharacterized protein LOC143298788 n=1 Tax=Babylonia areolata TaxID=304850 RepID=UPI003FD27715